MGKIGEKGGAFECALCSKVSSDNTNQTTKSREPSDDAHSTTFPKQIQHPRSSISSMPDVKATECVEECRQDNTEDRMTELENELAGALLDAAQSRDILDDLVEGMQILTRMMKHSFDQDRGIDHTVQNRMSYSGRKSNAKAFVIPPAEIVSDSAEKVFSFDPAITPSLSSITPPLPSIRSRSMTCPTVTPIKLPSTPKERNRNRCNTWDDASAPTLITDDDLRLSQLECLTGHIGNDFFALSNACRMLQQNARLTSLEATSAVGETHLAVEAAKKATDRARNAESLAKKLILQNQQLRDELKQAKKDRRYLAKEVKSMLLHQANMANMEGMLEKENLLRDIEQHVVASIQVHEQNLHKNVHHDDNETFDHQTVTDSPNPSSISDNLSTPSETDPPSTIASEPTLTISTTDTSSPNYSPLNYQNEQSNVSVSSLSTVSQSSWRRSFFSKSPSTKTTIMTTLRKSSKLNLEDAVELTPSPTPTPPPPPPQTTKQDELKFPKLITEFSLNILKRFTSDDIDDPSKTLEQMKKLNNQEHCLRSLAVPAVLPDRVYFTPKKSSTLTLPENCDVLDLPEL